MVECTKDISSFSELLLASFHVERFNRFLEKNNPRALLNGLRVRPLKSDQFYLCRKTIRIWSCTLRSLEKTFPLDPNIFDYVIFDESSQIDIASALPAMYRAKNAIVIGDDSQLQPIVKLPRKVETAIRNDIFEDNHNELNILDYNESSILKYVDSKVNISKVCLNKHYRSHDDIVFMYNSIFYQNNLKVLTLPADQNKHVF